jgi:hypothetical protein
MGNCSAHQNNPFSETSIIGRGNHPIFLALTRGIGLENLKVKPKTDGEIAMTSKTKSALAAALIAAFATPALAQGAAPLYYGDQAKQSRTVIEGRNAGTINATSTGRDSVVQTLGN